MPRPVQPPTCAACGDDLTGLPVLGKEIRCPECGGNRVRLYRWYAPGLSLRRAWLYLPVAALAAGPGLAVGWLIVRATGAPLSVLLGGRCTVAPPCLGVLWACAVPGAG